MQACTQSGHAMGNGLSPCNAQGGHAPMLLEQRGEKQTPWQKRRRLVVATAPTATNGGHRAAQVLPGAPTLLQLWSSPSLTVQGAAGRLAPGCQGQSRHGPLPPSSSRGPWVLGRAARGAQAEQRRHQMSPTAARQESCRLVPRAPCSAGTASSPHPSWETSAGPYPSPRHA